MADINYASVHPEHPEWDAMQEHSVHLPTMEEHLGVEDALRQKYKKREETSLADSEQPL